MIRKKHITAPKVIMPGHVSGPYWLLGDQDDPETEEIVGLIAYASPQSVYLGCSEEPAEEGILVLYQPDSLKKTGGLLERGVAPERISFMPLTTEYAWAPWVVWRSFKSQPELRRNLHSQEAFDHISQFYPITSEWDRADQYWGAYRAHINEHRVILDMVSKRLCDEKSRQVFDLVLRSDPAELWTHFVDTIFTTCDYLSRAVPFANDTILNLGVFSGPELPYFMTLVGDNGVVHNIDPLGNDKFDDYTREFVATCPSRAREVRVAAGQKNEHVSFHIGGDGQMRQGGDIELTSLPLDEYVKQQSIKSVNFIKIDIEGMEIEALFGMNNTIRRCRPTLAISIYHQADHLWRIPLMLMQGLDNYDFFIDHFSPLRTETILTAVPKELRGIAHGLNKAPNHLSITPELFYPQLTGQSSAQAP